MTQRSVQLGLAATLLWVALAPGAGRGQPGPSGGAQKPPLLNVKQHHDGTVQAIRDGRNLRTLAVRAAKNPGMRP